MTVSFPRLLPAVAAAIALNFAMPLYVEARAETVAVPTRDGMPTLAPLVEKVLPGVVGVATRTKIEVSADNPLFRDPTFRRFFGNPRGQPEQQERSAAGSGVIIDAKKGYVLTNAHVIDEATDISVSLYDRRVFTAKVIGKDEGTDVALLQIESKNLTQLTIGDSDNMKVGDYVVAIGNPFQLGHTVTQGIVSAKGRGSLGIEGFEDFIQTDASINPGNSGGALVNLKGELIGINTAILGPNGGNIGIGFAIPTSMFKAVMAQLVEYGMVKRGQIGVQITNMDPEIAKNLGIDRAEGALVATVVKGSPAERAGIKAGDVVIELDGKPVRSSNDLRNRLGLMTVGTSVNLAILRDKSRRDIKVTIGKTPDEQVLARLDDRPALEGASYSNPEPDDKQKGVKVTDVEQGSRAFRLGLRPGDIIVAVNRKNVGNIEEFKSAMKESQRQTALFVRRGEEDVLLLVP